MGFSDDFETFLFDESDNSVTNSNVGQQPSNIVENHNNSNLRRRTLSRPQHNSRQNVNNVQNSPQNNNFEQSLPQNTNNTTTNSNSFNVDADEFEQFLRWKQAQNNNNKTNITTNNSNNGQSFNTNNNSYEDSYYYNSPQQVVESDYIRPVADNNENVTNSSNMPTITEYPKNLPDGHGPVVERINHHIGKKVKIEGIPYERLPKSYQKMLDEQPTDEAGELRIFVYSDGGRSVGSIIELGSSEAAKRLASKLDNSRRLLNKPSGISYNVRPSLDKIKH